MVEDRTVGKETPIIIEDIIDITWCSGWCNGDEDKLAPTKQQQPLLKPGDKLCDEGIGEERFGEVITVSINNYLKWRRTVASKQIIFR